MILKIVEKVIGCESVYTRHIYNNGEILKIVVLIDFNGKTSTTKDILSKNEVVKFLDENRSTFRNDMKETMQQLERDIRLNMILE